MNPRTDPRDRLQIWEILVLICGVAVGLTLFSTTGKDKGNLTMLALGIFGGVALVGPPILLLKRRGRTLRRPWGPGNVLWFAQGTAAWLLFPPVAVLRWKGSADGFGIVNSTSATCFAYGTPMMSLYLVISLLAGDWIRLRRPSKRRRRRRSWTEVFGLLLGLGWACTGGYLIAMFWLEDIRR